MLAPALKQQLQGHLEKVSRPVDLVAVLGADGKSAELRELLVEVADLSPRLALIETGAVEPGSDGTGGAALRCPSFSVQARGREECVAFAGLPLGHEFTSLVLALLQVGGHPPNVEPELADQIRALDGDYEFETFFSLSCQICPEVVQALNAMSVLNPRIRHTAIDGALFPDEVEARKVMAVPSVFLDGQSFGQGHLGIEEIVAKLDSGAADRAAAALAEKPAFDVLIVGGGPAASAAAVYAARKGIRTGVVSERFGGQVLDTLGIENLISVPYTEGPQLASALEQNVKEHEVDVMNLQRAKGLVPAREAGGLHGVELESGARLSARTLVLATGARWRELGVPGESEYKNRGVAYCPHCDGPLFKGKRVAVVGGGNSGVEAAIDLAGIVGHVTLLEYEPALRADEVLQRSLEALPNVDIVLNADTREVLGDGERVSGLRVRDRQDETVRSLELEGVFVQIGLLPNTEWLEGSVELSAHREVVVDARGATSLPGVFAAGDCTTVPYKQIVVALGAGCTAALSAFDHLIRNRQAVATDG